MVIEQAQAIRGQRSGGEALQPAASDRIAQIIAIAGVWDTAAEPGPSDGLPPPRAGWAPTFAMAAGRGFLPRSVHVGEET